MQLSDFLENKLQDKKLKGVQQQDDRKHCVLAENQTIGFI
jgi:hypothetical protein